MVRMRFTNDEKSLRDQIFELLQKSATSTEEDLKALLQCSAHIQDRILVETIARECELTLFGFLAKDDLELYYDIKRGECDIGYISKGWEEPGFRIGDLVVISKSRVESFKARAGQLLKHCATRGIVMTVEESVDSIILQVDGVIYNEGFNKITFMKTLSTLNTCVEKAHELIG